MRPAAAPRHSPFPLRVPAARSVPASPRPQLTPRPRPAAPAVPRAPPDPRLLFHGPTGSSPHPQRPQPRPRVGLSRPGRRWGRGSFPGAIRLPPPLTLALMAARSRRA